MRRALLVLLLAALGALALPLPSHAAGKPLSATANPAYGKPGTFVNVVGSGWPAGAHVQLITCGQLGLGGTPDCDTKLADTTIASPAGAFVTDVVLGRPPVPCPCVINVTAAESPGVVNIPVRVTGIAIKAPTLPAGSDNSSISVISADLTGWGPWTAFFGAAPKRTLELKVRNVSARTIDDATLRLYQGPQGSTTGDLAVVPLGSIKPTQVRTYRVPVTLDAGLGGTSTIRGAITGAQEFVVTTTSHAWGFYVLDLLLLGVLAWFLVRWVRRRRRPTEGERRKPKVDQKV